MIVEIMADKITNTESIRWGKWLATEGIPEVSCYKLLVDTAEQIVVVYNYDLSTPMPFLRKGLPTVHAYHNPLPVHEPKVDR